MQQIYRVAARNQHESARLIGLDEAADLKDCPQQAQVQKTAQKAKELYFQAEAQQLLAGADLADPQPENRLPSCCPMGAAGILKTVEE